MKSGRPLGRPTGNRLERALGRFVGDRGPIADLVDRLGLVPREVELREHPDTPALGVNIGTTATVDEAVAMGRRYLKEAAEHGLERDGIWVWYTRPSGMTARIWVEPEPPIIFGGLPTLEEGDTVTLVGKIDLEGNTPPGYDFFHGPLTKLSPHPPWGGVWSGSDVNSTDFAVSPAEAARRVVERPWDAHATENTENKGGTMQDEKLADRLEREDRERRTRETTAEVNAERDRWEVERDAERRAPGPSAVIVGDYASGGETPGVIPGGLVDAAERHAAEQRGRDKLEDELVAATKRAADLRVAIAAALPVVRKLADRADHGLNLTDLHPLAELERIAVGGDPMDAAARISALDADLGRALEANARAGQRELALHTRLGRHERAARTLVRHLGGDSPAWWVEAGEAVGELRQLTAHEGAEPINEADRP